MKWLKTYPNEESDFVLSLLVISSASLRICSAISAEYCVTEYTRRSIPVQQVWKHNSCPEKFFYHSDIIPSSKETNQFCQGVTVNANNTA